MYATISTVAKSFLAESLIDTITIEISWYNVHSGYCESYKALANAGAFSIRRKEGIGMRLTLTDDYRKIGMAYGLFQNLSTTANIELSEDPQQEGVILKPSQIAMISRPVYARKSSGATKAILAILPFADSGEQYFEEHEPPTSTHRHECSPRDEPEAYVIKIPRELIERGQHKFIVEFPH